jgi:AcrR family transcriptional regulator
MASRALGVKTVATVSPWKPSSERARQREIKRDAVVLAAARAFRLRGYHNTSVDDLAALLNVTKPTIYHYLDNKEEILFECFRTGLDQIKSAFDDIRDSTAPAIERLTAVMRKYAEAITSEFGWCMVRAEDQDLSPVMSKRINTLKSEIDQGIRRLIKDGIADGSIRRCDPKITAFALAGAMNWIAHWHRADAELTPDQIADRFIETFVNGLQPR